MDYNIWWYPTDYNDIIWYLISVFLSVGLSIKQCIFEAWNVELNCASVQYTQPTFLCNWWIATKQWDVWLIFMLSAKNRNVISNEAVWSDWLMAKFTHINMTSYQNMEVGGPAAPANRRSWAFSTMEATSPTLWMEPSRKLGWGLLCEANLMWGWVKTLSPWWTSK